MSQTFATTTPQASSPERNYGNTSPSKKVAERGSSEEPELEGGSLHLVPCRWSLSGWKYVKADPGDHKFFNNPHRINGQGIYTGN